MSDKAFICEHCRKRDSMVVNSRPHPFGRLRRRQCKCGLRFSTIEVSFEEYKVFHTQNKMLKEIKHYRATGKRVRGKK